MGHKNCGTFSPRIRVGGGVGGDRGGVYVATCITEDVHSLTEAHYNQTLKTPPLHTLAYRTSRSKQKQNIADYVSHQKLVCFVSAISFSGSF